MLCKFNKHGAVLPSALKRPNLSRDTVPLIFDLFTGVMSKMPGGFCLEDLDLYDELDSETQARLDHCVDRLLKGYDWTLSPLANK
jgi:hypothetical protein